MISWKIVSDGLRDFSGVSQTLHLGGRKNLKRRHFYSCFLPVLFMSLLNVSTYNIFCESIIISLQRSNEIYRDIKCPHAHIRSALFVSLIFNTWVFVFILNCGDVHPNKGPGSDNGLLVFHDRIVMIHLECYRII